MKARLAAVVLGGAWLAAACRSGPEQVVVGIGLSGSDRPAVALAASEINGAGGIRGARLVLLDAPDSRGNRYDPPVVLGMADRFVATPDLLAVIGHGDSATTLSAGAVYNRHGLPNLVTIATNPAITNLGPWTYRLCLSDAVQAPALAEYAVRTWNKRRIAVFAVSDDYGRALSQRFEKRVEELGGTITSLVAHRNVLQPDDQEMIRSSLVAMKTTTPDLIALFQRVAAARWTVRAIREAGLGGVDVLGGDDLAQSSFIDADADVSGVRVSQFVHLDDADKRAAAFRVALRAPRTTGTDYSRAFAYDAVYLVRDAILGGGFSRAGIRRYLDRLVRDGTAVHGVSGTFTIGPDHDARRALYVAEVRDGAFQVLQAIGPDR